MDKTDKAPDESETGLLGKARVVLDSVTDGARKLKDAGQQRVADRRDQRRRDELLRELGELYFDALSAGKDAPAPARRDRVMADIDALDSPTRSEESETDDEEEGSTDGSS